MRFLYRLVLALAMLVSVLGWILYLSRDSAVAVVMDLVPAALTLFGLSVLLLLVIVLRSARLRWPTIVVAIASLAGLGFSLWSFATGVPSEDVAFTSGAVELRGTVYSAKGESRSPGVVLVHGSGRETRSEHRFYARFLAERGITTLAFDKRGAGASSGNTYEADYLDYADDVVAAVECLARTPNVDPDRIGLVGFSEAEWVAPVAENRSDLISFIVIVGASGLRPVDQVEEEIRLRLERKGFAEADVRKAAALHRLYSDYLRGNADAPRVRSEIEKAARTPWFAAAEDLPDQVYPREEYAWWRRVMDFDPAPYWRRVDVPVLLLKGTEDDRSAAEPSAERLKAMISAPLEVRLLQGADHMLLRWPIAPRIPPPVFAAGYPQIVADWIQRKVRVPAKATGPSHSLVPWLRGGAFKLVGRGRRLPIESRRLAGRATVSPSLLKAYTQHQPD